ncbi:MAG: response regulator [Flavobacteriales bacterium]|nr:response regulator [Flavobacteriales bacterium]
MLNALIVDDELKSREVIKTLLENFCPEVNVVGTAENIQEALNAIHTLNPNLVFLDISLKEGDSFQILQQLEEITFEIIFVTAYDEYSVKALKYSGITCLFKPLDIEELQHAVKRVVKQKTNIKTAYQMVNGILKSKFTQIPVITPSGLLFASVDEILYINELEKGSEIHFFDKPSVKSKRNIKEFQDIIVNKEFQLVGKELFVNMRHLNTNLSTKRQLVFNNKERIDLSTFELSKLLDFLRG